MFLACGELLRFVCLDDRLHLFVQRLAGDSARRAADERNAKAPSEFDDFHEPLLGSGFQMVPSSVQRHQGQPMGYQRALHFRELLIGRVR